MNCQKQSTERRRGTANYNCPTGKICYTINEQGECKPPEKINVILTSDIPPQEIFAKGETYTLELVSASDAGATIKVTNNLGTSDSKTINEGSSRIINTLSITLNSADESNFGSSAVIEVYTRVVCGNDIIEEGEQCDDGNN